MRWIGRWLFAVGMVHTLFGVFFSRGILGTLASEGLFNTVNGQPDREAAFWFLCTGALLLVIGVLVDLLEQRSWPVPVFVSLAFLMLTVVGVVVMPLSGIWLLLPPAAGLILRSRREPID